MRIRPLSERLKRYLTMHQLDSVWAKQTKMFVANQRYPGLHVELLEPKYLHLYSFRLTRQYRAVFIDRGNGTVEIIDINNHYQ